MRNPMTMADRCSQLVSRILYETMFSREGCGGYGSGFAMLHPELRDTDALIRHAVAMLVRVTGAAVTMATLEPLMMKALPYYTDEHIGQLLHLLTHGSLKKDAPHGHAQQPFSPLRRPPAVRKMATPTECAGRRVRSRCATRQCDPSAAECKMGGVEDDGAEGLVEVLECVGVTPQARAPVMIDYAEEPKLEGEGMTLGHGVARSCEAKGSHEPAPRADLPAPRADLPAPREIVRTPASVPSSRPETAPASQPNRFLKPWGVYVDLAGHRYMTDEHAQILPMRQLHQPHPGDAVQMTPCFDRFRIARVHGSSCDVEVGVPMEIEVLAVEGEQRAGRLYGSLALKDLPARPLLGVEIRDREEAARWSAVVIALSTEPESESPVRARSPMIRLKPTVRKGVVRFMLPEPFVGDNASSARLRVRVTVTKGSLPSLGDRKGGAEIPRSGELTVRVLQADTLRECPIPALAALPEVVGAVPATPRSSPTRLAPISKEMVVRAPAPLRAMQPIPGIAPIAAPSLRSEPLFMLAPLSARPPSREGPLSPAPHVVPRLPPGPVPFHPRPVQSARMLR